MKNSILSRGIALIPLALLALSAAACSSLPSSGPGMDALDKTPGVNLVDVTAASASAMAIAEANDRASALKTARSAAAAGETTSDSSLAVGDKIDVVLWVYTVPTTGAGASVLPTAPTQQDLGDFVIDHDGNTSLPYIGRVHLAGCSIETAESAVKGSYDGLHTMVGPTVSIRVAESPTRDVLVTGAVGQPKRLPWTPNGMTMAEALTAASGNGAGGLAGDPDRERGVAASHVEILRDDETVANLPTPVALRSNIALRPGDTLVVDDAAAVKVAVLGGGATKVGAYGFAEGSTLTDALASSEGLNSNTADARALFVLRDKGQGTPTLYSFALRSGDGLIAARRFPLHDGDMIYEAEAPSVAIGRVVSMLYGIAMPALLAK